jgi:hypothetical protein
VDDAVEIAAQQSVTEVKPSSAAKGGVRQEPRPASALYGESFGVAWGAGSACDQWPALLAGSRSERVQDD